MSIAGVSFSVFSAAASQAQNQPAQQTQSVTTGQTGSAAQTATAQPSGRAHHHHHHGGETGSQEVATAQASGSAGTLNTIA
jgi:hypothetical protein